MSKWLCVLLLVDSLAVGFGWIMRVPMLELLGMLIMQLDVGLQGGWINQSTERFWTNIESAEFI
jgi:hypothetical protein